VFARVVLGICHSCEGLFDWDTVKDKMTSFLIGHKSDVSHVTWNTAFR